MFDKKDDYRQRNVRKFWLPHESHTGMSLPSLVLRVEAFGYIKIV